MVNSVVERYFQLEESEDQETCTTELFFNADGSIFLGETDGPLPTRASGTWQQDPHDDSITMNISRTFNAGQPQTEFTDMGEFHFTVERIFEGQVSNVGAVLGLTGSIYDVDDVFGDRQVGFFNMIDTTDVKLNKNDEEGEQLPQFGRKQVSW